MNIRLKRIYESASEDDGQRILVDRVWPRGISKSAAGLDAWLKDLAPSTELRKWFGHDPDKWKEFQQRYRTELREQSDAVDDLVERVQSANTTTLLYGAKDEEHNQAVVLNSPLRERLG